MSEQPQSDDLGFELPAAGKTSRAGIVIVIVVLAGGGFAFGYIQHKKSPDAVLARGDGGAAKVEVLKPTALTSDRALALPGVMKALEETKIFPRTTGYVRRWLVDIGDAGKEGQVLAEIETPDLDPQLLQ